ncbi:phosphoribosyl-AMP cyclohydrolase [Calditerrivibrio nitroreducens]|uniref:Phosphoribosyl-AMP cyclohydrolase n=1 Tax=Calditerrivibrio nitroreducens (strain DSM 19672 / NBRC 101217 / Yu37-1) TaxID=768670 RepID=E4TEL6_CALNY|nr:phosphoribosyl-AMP cyclohydrolase [Calditerrivibrio nitroreducens]ADR19373.1 Phosphoribosyl-AMP cyclohydrolase [Calditerrivibrio nitroreducens DSM 19672]
MEKVDLNDIKWTKLSGLVPVVVQDVDSKDVLMQAFVNEEALRLTIKTGYAHYFSRSRNMIWKKGETSGHTQKIVKILIDCDEDCILYMVKQSGVACHTGEYSCFFREINALE